MKIEEFRYKYEGVFTTSIWVDFNDTLRELSDDCYVKGLLRGREECITELGENLTKVKQRYIRLNRINTQFNN